MNSICTGGCLSLMGLWRRSFGLNSFCCAGNRDYSPYLSLLSAIKFWDTFGLQKAWKYIDDLLAQGVELLVNEWGTESLVPKSLSCRSMALVRLKNGIFNQLPPSKAAEKIQVGLQCLSLLQLHHILHSRSEYTEISVCGCGVPWMLLVVKSLSWFFFWLCICRMCSFTITRSKCQSKSCGESCMSGSQCSFTTPYKTSARLHMLSIPLSFNNRLSCTYNQHPYVWKFDVRGGSIVEA